MDEHTVLSELIKLSLTLGKPENDYVIVGEGNSSARIDDSCFFVKASGKYLSESDKDTFVKVKTNDVLSILDNSDISDDEIRDALAATCFRPESALQPSIETVFHAFLLSLPDVNFVGHTHPTAINSILCSMKAEEIIKSRIIPNELAYFGQAPIFIEHPEPGIGLARAIRQKTLDYIKTNGYTPKAIMVQSHGLIAIGNTPREVEAITAIWCKTARVIANTFLFGGPRFLSD